MIREYSDTDFNAVTHLWPAARLAAMPELEARLPHTIEQDRVYFRAHVVTENRVWVYQLETHVVGFLALQNEFIDRLYVDHAHHRQGIGSKLLTHARTLMPDHLWLYTHQKNIMARHFYEKHGFLAERFGISPAPECEPDVEYHWRALK